MDLGLAKLVFADSPEVVHDFMTRNPGGGVLLEGQLTKQFQKELDNHEAITQIIL